MFNKCKAMQESDEKSIGALPNEILLTIFSYLQTSDVKHTVSKVCTRWSNLSRDKKLWSRLRFRTTNRSTKTFGSGSWYSTLKFLENTPEVRNVVVSRGHTEDELVELLDLIDTHSKNLYELEFDGDVEHIAKHFRRLVNIFDRVESLRLRLGSRQASVFAVLPGFKNLRKIAFSGSDPEPSAFRAFVRGSNRLEAVDVSGVGEFARANFNTLWQFRERLAGLRLRIDRLDESCMKLLSVFPRLTDVGLVDGNASPGKLSKIGRLKCLRVLHLQEDASSPVLTPKALADFFQSGSLHCLRELRLHKSRLNDEGAAEIRRNCANLLYLEVTTYPRCISSLSEKALLHFLHCKRLLHFEIIFDNSEEADWIYRRIRHVRHDCSVDDEICSLGLEGLLECWDEIQIPVD